MKNVLLITILLTATSPVFAAVQYGGCFEEHAARYDVSPELLITIAKQESGISQKAINNNKNGTEDVGVMQINSANFKSLQKYGLSENQIREDACTNIRAGAIILSDNIKRLGNTWKAVGAYNARSEDKRKHYAWKIYQRYQELKL